MEQPPEKIVRDSFNDYINALVQLKEAVNQMRIQTKATNKAVERVLNHTHLNAVLTLTRNVEFLSKADL